MSDDKIIYLWGKDALPVDMEWQDSDEDDEMICNECGENNWAIKFDEEGRKYIICLTRYQSGEQCKCVGSMPDE